MKFEPAARLLIHQRKQPIQIQITDQAGRPRPGIGMVNTSVGQREVHEVAPGVYQLDVRPEELDHLQIHAG